MQFKKDLHNTSELSGNRLKDNKINPLVVKFAETVTTIKFQILLIIVLGITDYFVLIVNGKNDMLIEFSAFFFVDTTIFFLYLYWIFPRITKGKSNAMLIIVILACCVCFHILLHLSIYAIFGADVISNFSIFTVFTVNSFHRAWQRLIITVFLGSAYIIKQLAKREQVLESNTLFSRVSPHLIFNALNMLPSTNVQPLQNDRLISLLSQYSRNAMKELAEDGKWSLSIEINQLEILLQINEIRFGSIYFIIEKDLPMNLEDFRVPPHIVLTLAENIFKYGVVNKVDKSVLISMKFVDRDFAVEITNHKALRTNITSSKSGLVSVQKRLENIYGKNYSFVIEDDQSMFKTMLRFPIF